MSIQRRTFIGCVLAAAAGPFSFGAEAKSVRTLAGTGVSGATGDGGPAEQAQVGNPYGLTIGPDGALYVCEIDTHRVRRIDLSDGRISTFAGSGERGYEGDGGPAREAKLDEPYEVRFGPDGACYFVEMKNAIVRRVDLRTGEISTVAGTGQEGFSGDGGPAREATFARPHSIAFDSEGLLYVCDIGNHRIRRIDLSDGRISTFAGTGERAPTPDGATVAGTPLNGPRTMTFDAAGDMFLALREGNAVYRVDMRSGTLHHLGGTGEQGYTGDSGPAKQAKLSGPKGIAVGPDGGVYLADTESHTIRRIDPRSGVIDTIVGFGERRDGPDGEPLECGLARPHGVYVHSDGVVYIGDSENHRVRALS